MTCNFYEYFYNAFYDSNKYSVITARRREGKTLHAVLYLFHQLQSNPNSKALWVDTVQANLDKYYDRYWAFHLSEFVKKGIIKYNRQSHILTFSNGSTIDFASAERPENLEGFGYDYIICNEAGIIFKKDALWDNTIAPMAKNARKVLLIGTPKGQNKFYELSKRENISSEWKTFRINPEKSFEWTQEELEQSKMEVPEMVFRQEYCGEFVGSGAGVFRVNNVTKMLSNSQTVVLGIDLGRHNDETVIHGLSKDCRTTFLESWTDTSFEVQKARIIEIWKKLGYPKVNLDMTGLGLAVYDSLSLAIGRSLEGITFTATSKRDLIQNMQILLEQGVYVTFDDKKLVTQINSYEYQSTKGGGITYNAPDGEHDDYVISTALALLEFRPQNKYSGSFFVG